jgi:MFS family permease
VASPRVERGPADAAPPATIGTVLRAPRFAFLVTGQTVSQLGDKLHHMALIALVGAAAPAAAGGLELAKLSVVFTAPVILAGPLAGALVDRWDKRITMIGCDTLRALLVLTLPVVYAATRSLWPVYAVSFVIFLLGVFFNAAKMALIPDLVARPHLLPANAALTFIGRIATVLGIVGGGLLVGLPLWRAIGWEGYEAGFYLDAGSYVISVLTLIAIVAIGGELRSATVMPGGPSLAPRRTRTLVRDVVAMLREGRRDPTLRFVFGTLLMLGLFASTVYVVMTYSVQTVMGRGPAGVGVLGGVLGAGLVVGALLVGTVGSRWDKRRTILRGTTVIGVLMTLAGVFFRFEMFLPVAFMGGLVLSPIMVSQDTILHEGAPPHARALVFSTKDLILAGAFMASALTVGGVVRLLGWLGVADPYRWAMLGVGTLILGLGSAGYLALPPGYEERTIATDA